MRMSRKPADGAWVSNRLIGTVHLYQPDPYLGPPAGADGSIPDRWKPETGPLSVLMAGSGLDGAGASIRRKGSVDASGCAASVVRSRPAGWVRRT